MTWTTRFGRPFPRTRRHRDGVVVGGGVPSTGHTYAFITCSPASAARRNGRFYTQSSRRLRHQTTSTSNEPSRSNHRVPRRRDEPIAAAGLLDVAEPGEREVIARDQELVGRSHVVDAPARRHGLLRLVVH